MSRHRRKCCLALRRKHDTQSYVDKDAQRHVKSSCRAQAVKRVPLFSIGFSATLTGRLACCVERKRHVDAVQNGKRHGPMQTNSGDVSSVGQSGCVASNLCASMPSDACDSNIVTSCARDKMHAAVNPAMPEPMMPMRCRVDLVDASPSSFRTKVILVFLSF